MRNLALGILITLLFTAAPQAHAAPLKGYEALQVSISGSKLTMKPGESKLVTLGFQNIGTATWSNTGAQFVSIYTYEPKYRTSVFQDASWYRPEQPVKLTEASVAPGSVGHISFTLHAPQTTGQYQETFYLAAEETAWIPGGLFSLNVLVSNEVAAPIVSAPSSTASTASPTGLSGLLLLKSAKSVTAEGGESVSFTVGIKNTGTVSWKQREVRVPDVSIATTGNETQHSSWLTSSTLVAKADAEVAPGELDLISFTFSAPRTKGSHVVKYAFIADGNTVPDVSIEIPVEVTTTAPEAYQSPRTVENTRDFIEEPILRVGVLIVDEETDWQVEVSCETPWKLRDSNGNLLAEMGADESVLAFYKNGKYYFDRGKGLESNSFPLRFIPNEKNVICTVENFDRRETRNFPYPDNTFRNILELRYNSTKDRTWLINELPMEFYLRGLGETSNISHLEFQKALLTVARTYALYHWERGTKRGPEGFHITAYADDQVYNGYGQEIRSPRLVQSVEATRGQVVTYDGETALTPYFSRSDGRTRDWSEVWYGEVEWLKSVPAPCDKGKTLWGHGVGLSASEALCQANNGKAWNDILHYFYTDVDIERRWE